MRAPFPGMDPYLEHPEVWADVHNRLIGAIADNLGPRLRPRYWTRLEERTYVIEPDGLLFVGRPDVAIMGRPGGSGASHRRGAVTVSLPMPERVRETYLEVRATGSGEVVTLLEVLSPSNKRGGEGRRLYEQKRRQTLGSLTHLVEIDLLRAGQPMAVLGTPPTGDYRILISRSEERPHAELIVFSIRESIPIVSLPLRAESIELELGSLLEGIYERAGYDLSVNYAESPEPPLEEIDRKWADQILQQAGLR